MTNLLPDRLPTDTYYRGYRLSAYQGEVAVYYGCDRIEVVASSAIAHEHIDSWLNAR